MTKKSIKERTPQSDAFLHENPVINRVLQNRGIKSLEELDLDIKNLLDPFLIKDMDKATDSLIDHLMEGTNICIVGDFDCDGATSTSIMAEGLKLLGFENVSYIVPDRQKHGYGLTPSIVDLAYETKKPDVIVTVDCGISSFDGADRVYDLGMELIITDHHLQDSSGKLPKCEAAVNINRNDCPFPSKNLAGCGVAFYLMVALRKKMRDYGIFQQKGMAEPNLGQLFDLVSLGTVADVVPLDRNNRILVKLGLDRTKRGLAREAINEVFKQKNKDIFKVKSSDWGFMMGPILNSAGRLENMTKGIEMLLDRNPGRVTDRVSELIELNETRKQIGREMELDTECILDNEEVNMGVVVFQPDWHEGVVGITASRVKEKVNRPVICLTETHEAKAAREKYEFALENNHDPKTIAQLKEEMDNSLIKGSARSIPGVHVRHVMDHINTENPGMIAKFGGHAMAAGISIPYNQFEAFKKAFDKACEEVIEPYMIEDSVVVDIHNVDPAYISLETAELINSFEPWGQKFESPVFSGQFIVREFRPIGKENNHLKMVVSPVGSDHRYETIQWQCCSPSSPPRVEVGHVVDCVYTLDINEWQGFRKVQLMVNYMYDEEYELNLQREANISKSSEMVI
ncbi:DHHA1 domain-containing protein [Vibrio diabolicus]|nr:DHHA1 domain-containing protein [Vibrio diabolicus]MCS0405027.1 DHHA1 domain-containing protein [Vibrio diabolicus]